MTPVYTQIAEQPINKRCLADNRYANRSVLTHVPMENGTGHVWVISPPYPILSHSCDTFLDSKEMENFVVARSTCISIIKEVILVIVIL